MGAADHAGLVGHHAHRLTVENMQVVIGVLRAAYVLFLGNQTKTLAVDTANEAKSQQ